MKIVYASYVGGAPTVWLSDGTFAVRAKDIFENLVEKDAEIDTFLSWTNLEHIEKLKDDVIAGHPNAVELRRLKLEAPVSKRSKIFCAAFNYRSHNAETQTNPPSAPYFFLKPTSALAGPFDQIIQPKISKKMDYEVELAVVIGRKAKYVELNQALDVVAGYMVANDVSYRDYQFTEYNPDLARIGRDWVLGKALDTGFPAGPWIATRDETGDDPFELICRVNGKTVQNASTADMIFDVPHLIARASQGITLYPGDVISTGTPSGVALGGSQPYLKLGDVVEGEISRIGTIRNTVVSE
jgi:2-keto-4-pentenoate hydratase/2-oxohepta-3-ene-1,7-dioic acid hydratase in catechol pathway